jgi:hypothetical protein
MDITEIQDELLRLEYPNLLPDHDPDIERYYYLRSIGQSRDAMIIYQNRLKIRYPDDDFRTWLLRSYRRHDPAFRGLLSKGYRMLGARSLDRIKYIIIYIAERAESYNEKDVYSTIKTAEEILQFLPPERYEAVAGMERFLRYSSALNLKVPSIAKATELVRAYLTDTLSVVEEERKRRSEALSRAEEMNRQRLVKADWDSYYYQKKYGVHAPLIDLSAVVFSQMDLARIEIPPFTRIEDQILGYCVKYWNAVDDPAFERILFLYSRKYGKKNYDVFMAIRRGRQAKHRDDEILASIMSILVTGYYYSIQGDIYLQRNWNALKNTLANQLKALPASVSPKAIEAKQTRTKRLEDTTKKRAVIKRRGGKEKPAKERSPAPLKSRLAPKPKTAPRIAPQAFKLKNRPAAVVAKPAHKALGQNLVPAQPVKVPYKLKPAQETKTTIVVQPAKAVQRPAVPQFTPRPAVPVRPAAKPVPKPVQAPVRRVPPAVAKPGVPAAPEKTAIPSRPVPPAPPKPPAPKPPAPPVQAPAPPAALSALPKPPAPASPVQPPKPAAVSSPAPKPPTPKPPAPKLPPPPVQSPGYRPAPYVSASPPPSRPKPKVFTNKTLEKAKGSVSDRLKQLSGRSYDVYEDRFLSKARNAIRKVLGTGRGLFFNLPEEAEDLVYNFLRDHYSDPYMDWEDSAERSSLSSLGFDLPSLNPVIDECYKAL